MDVGTVVATADIDKGAIADDKWATRIIRHRGFHYPATAALFVDVDWSTDRVVAARGNDTGIPHRCTVEPQPGRVHVPAHGPSVQYRVVNLCGRGGHRKGSTASKQMESPVQHRAAGPGHWQWHRRALPPGVAGDIVDVQRVYFPAAIVAAGNI